MIKVRVGQVWASNNSKNEFTLNIGANGLINGKSKLGGIYNWNKTDFHRCFKFIPQNDLEWLAVKIDKWAVSFSNFIARASGGWVDYSTPCLSVNYPQAKYTREQWQNMRYHLGLDKKPHYRLTGGDWVKV